MGPGKGEVFSVFTFNEDYFIACNLLDFDYFLGNTCPGWEHSPSCSDVAVQHSMKSVMLSSWRTHPNETHRNSNEFEVNRPSGSA